MAPVNYTRLAAEWRILLDWCESGQKESLKKACADDHKTYMNCIGHNKVLRSHEDKKDQVALCLKKVAEYEQKEDKKTSKGGSVADNSEELSNLKKRIETLLERNEALEEKYSDLMDAVKDVKTILTADITLEKEDGDDDDSDKTEEPFNGLDFISMAEDYVERNDKMFNDHHEKMKKSLDDALEAKKKALNTVIKQGNTIAEKDKVIAGLEGEVKMLQNACMTTAATMVKRTEDMSPPKQKVVVLPEDDEYVESGSEHPEESDSDAE
jgi:predicted  nucleic acid-binding Zn-ribbon protein